MRKLFDLFCLFFLLYECMYFNLLTTQWIHCWMIFTFKIPSNPRRIHRKHFQIRYMLSIKRNLLPSRADTKIPSGPCISIWRIKQVKSATFFKTFEIKMYMKPISQGGPLCCALMIFVVWTKLSTSQDGYFNRSWYHLLLGTFHYVCLAIRQRI